MSEYVKCPFCRNKTKVKVNDDTVLDNFPLYCPVCKRERVVTVRNKKIVKVVDKA